MTDQIAALVEKGEVLSHLSPLKLRLLLLIVDAMIVEAAESNRRDHAA